LPVSAEIKDVFKLIERYQPQNIELDFKLKPFIPDYIPSIGDIDAFLKVPRPDGKPDNLGLTVVDEPSSNQSDPHVLDLFFRTLSKQNVEVAQPTVSCHKSINWNKLSSCSKKNLSK
jgi:intraflagellar transport protein 46